MYKIIDMYRLYLSSVLICTAKGQKGDKGNMAAASVMSAMAVQMALDEVDLGTRLYFSYLHYESIIKS